MTSFYKFQRMAFTELDKMIQSTMERKTDLNISFIILNLTNKYEVSDKALKKRVQYWIESYDQLELKDNILRCK